MQIFKRDDAGFFLRRIIETAVFVFVNPVIRYMGYSPVPVWLLVVIGAVYYVIKTMVAVEQFYREVEEAMNQDDDWPM